MVVLDTTMSESAVAIAMYVPDTKFDIAVTINGEKASSSPLDTKTYEGSHTQLTNNSKFPIQNRADLDAVVPSAVSSEDEAWGDKSTMVMQPQKAMATPIIRLEFQRSHPITTQINDIIIGWLGCHTLPVTGPANTIPIKKPEVKERPNVKWTTSQPQL